MSRSIPFDRLESILVVLIALHSYAVGVLLLLAAPWGVDFGGWGRIDTYFFSRQAGAFHLVVATGYLLEYSRYRGITLMVLAKSTAVVFLTIMMLLGEPWLVPFSAATDGLMLVAVLWIHRRAVQQRATASGV